MFRRPLFPPLIAWIAGVLLAQGTPHPDLTGAALAIAGCLFFLLSPSKRTTRASVLIFLAGVGVLRFLFVFSLSPRDLSHLALPYRGVSVVVTGRLADDPQTKKKRESFPLDAESVRLFDRAIPVEGRAQVRIYHSSLAASPFASLEYGDRIRLRALLCQPSPSRNPGEYDDRAYLARQGIRSLLIVGESKDAPLRRGVVERLDSAGFSWVGLCLGIKRRMETILRRDLLRRDADTMSGILFSEQTRLSRQLQKDFVTTGTVHLLSTSGVHVAALAAALTWILGAYRRRYRKPFAIGMILLLAMFGMMSGMRPAIARATFMASLAFGADLFDREPDGANLLCFAALAILISNPLNLYDLGFQYSFAAVAGLILLVPRIEPYLKKLLKAEERDEPRAKMAAPLAATLAAECAILPISAFYTQRISLISVVANLVIIPLSAPLVPGGLIQAVSGVILPGIAGIFSDGVTGLLVIFCGIIHFFASIPYASIFVPMPSVGFMLLVYSVLLFCARPWALRSDPPPALPGVLKSSRAALALLAVVLVAALIASGSPYFGSRNQRLTITGIDVGQGDCFLVRTPDGASMLIDGGGIPVYADAESEKDDDDDSDEYDIGDRVVVPYLRRIGVRNLDLVVMTHPDGDHIGGLGAVLEQMPTRLLIDSGDRDDTEPFQRIDAAVRAKRIPRRSVTEGDRIRLGGETELEILNPGATRFKRTASDFNNNCVTFRLRYRNFSALFTGDLAEEGEKRLLPELGPVDLLKVAHHGSKYSTSEALVERTHPRIAMIGVGLRNRFGHPNSGVLDRLERNGAEVYRTDRDGTLWVETDGETVRARSHLLDHETAFRLEPR